jgi:hypothetical protein
MFYSLFTRSGMWKKIVPIPFVDAAQGAQRH